MRKSVKPSQRNAGQKVNPYFQVFPQGKHPRQVISTETSTSHPSNKEFQGTEEEKTSPDSLHEASMTSKTKLKEVVKYGESVGQSHSGTPAQKF